MKLDNLAGMFSQRSGVQQSMSSTIMSTIMSYMMHTLCRKDLVLHEFWRRRQKFNAVIILRAEKEDSMTHAIH